MPSVNELPTKDQIAAIDDVEALEGIRDEVDRAIARIETDLDYSGRDDAWYERAKNALAYHKYIDTLLTRRVRQLSKAPRPAPALPCPGVPGRRQEWSAFTQAAFDGEIIAPENVPDDLLALDGSLATLLTQMNAIKADRDDELTRFKQGNQDVQFLTRCAVALRQCGAAHQALLVRAAAIRRVVKQAEHAVRDATRPQMFVDVAREVLDRDTFMAIWEAVDRRQSAQKVAA